MIGVFLIIMASSLWAVDTLIRYPLLQAGVPASSIVFTEHCMLVIAMLPVLWGMRTKILNMKAIDLIGFVCIGGFGSALASVAFTRAFGLINPSLVILLQKFQPLVAILLARFLLKEPIKKEFIGWAALCLFGGILVSYRDLAGGLSQVAWGGELWGQGHLLGYALTFLAVFGWGASTVFGKSLGNHQYTESELMAGRFVFGLLFLLPYLGGDQFPIPQNTEVLGKIFLMVVLSGFLGMFLYYMGLKRISARLCALAEMFFPFCAVTVNWIFLDATLSFEQIIGAGLLMLGSTVIQIRHY